MEQCPLLPLTKAGANRKIVTRMFEFLLAEEVVATIDNSAQLIRLSTKLGGAQNTEQARQILSQLVQ